MSVDIVGAGAIGGTLGAMLARRGVAVRLLDSDPEHVAAIQRGGLQLRGLEKWRGPVPAILLAEVEGPLETVVLAVKTQHVPDAVAVVARRLTPNGCVVSLQNGIAAHEVARWVGPQRTIPGSVSYAGHRVGPGEILYGAPGGLSIGDYCGGASSRTRALGHLLAPFGDVDVETNIWGVIWAKLALAGIYAATALDGRPMPDIFADEGARAVLTGIATEIVETGAAEGVEPTAVKDLNLGAFRFGPRGDPAAQDRTWKRLFDLASAVADRKPHSGVYYDLAVLRRPTEVAAMLEPVIERAGRFGVSVTLLPRVVAVIAELERDHTQMSPSLLRAMAG